ncbi:MAG: hypothetical protein ACYS7Y_35085 [Planctomycetota bacterium]|jgi:hypothetical protein
MATKAQIAANRRNSRKSTGPRTAEGKEAVSENAFKHGLFVKKDVVRDESQEEYDVHRDALVADLAPAGPMEAFLVYRIVRLSWRLIRAERMQDHSTDYLGLYEICGQRGQDYRCIYRSANRIYDDDVEIPREHFLLGRVAVRDFSHYKVLEKMQLYERRLESSLHKTRAELQKLQAARKAEEKAREKSAPADDQANLKKQSQSPTSVSLTSGSQQTYVNDAGLDSLQDRPNRTQFKDRAGAPATTGGRRRTHLSVSSSRK